MTIFADASAVVAIIAQERDALELIDRLAAEEAIWSAMSRWETISSLRFSHRWTLVQARACLLAFGNEFNLRIVSVGSEEDRIALDAYERYGKGRHPARLNMGDCFAYACAKTNNARLLYKGDDFAHTDLA